MEPHDFWNLAGRAGRWGDEFQGNIICIEPTNEKAWPTGVPKRSRYPIKRETDVVMADVSGLVAYLDSRASVEMNEIKDAAQFEQVSAFLINTFTRTGSLSKAGLSKRHDQETIKSLDEKLSILAGSLKIPEEIAIRHPGVNPIGLQRLLESFQDYKLDVENLVPAPSESTDAYDRFVSVMRRINKSVFPAFTPDGIVPLHALVVVEWLKGLSLAFIIRQRIDYQVRHDRPYKLAQLIRETMEMVETVARFKAPKYISAYVDVLNFHLNSIGRDDLIDEDLDIGVALEFGVSSQTLLSLMELG
ncbi:MAG: DEAD/DEAH box helicase, partial [Cyanobacteria bacterium J06576_12]